MKRLPLLVMLLAALLLAACDRTPGMVLKREPMARLLADLQLAEALSNEQRLSGYGPDSMRLALRRSVLAKHGTNEAVLDSSLRWYGAHLPRFMKVIDRADSILADSMRVMERDARRALALAAGDSADLWPAAPSAVFARSEPSGFLPFELAADSTWRRGDVFTLEFAFDNAMSDISATIAVDYLNRRKTTEAMAMRQYPGDMRRMEIKLQLDSNMSAGRIYGYLQLKPAEGERAFVDSIRLVRTRLVASEYSDLRRPMLRLSRHVD